MLPVNFLVVRHGESIGNLAKRMSEKGDDALLARLHGTHTAHWPLTKKGRAQAKMTGEFLNQLNMSFDKMYVSSYARAMQTAAQLELIRSEWSVDPRITERDWGDLDCLTEEERQQKFGEALEMRTVEPFFWSPPNGESFNELIIRIRNFIGSIQRINVPNVIVVCHGEVMKAFRIILLQLTPMEYAEMEFSKDPLKRIHNCQIDHYSRRDPKTLKLSTTKLEWLQVYRPYEDVPVAIEWKFIPRRRYHSSELAQMANKLSAQFADLDL